MKAIWDERYRLISFNLNGRRWMELYDRERDPSETWNLVDELPHERERLARELDARFPPGSRGSGLDVDGFAFQMACRASRSQPAEDQS